MDPEDNSAVSKSAAPAGRSFLSRLKRKCPITLERPTLGKREKTILKCLGYYLAFMLLFIIVVQAYFLSKDFVVAQQRTAEHERHQDDGEHRSCETIHLATVCGGHKSTRDFYIQLKSILFHRKAFEISYHLFVDNVSSKILTKLFETWTVPGLTITMYNITNYEKDISWIPNSHYSNRYGLLKLMVPSILAAESNVKKVLLLDTDMLVMGNLKHVWKQFSDMDGTYAFLGLVENQSDWYLSKKMSRSEHIRPIFWPALGRGFNTGLMLIDVKKAMAQKWDELWRDVTETELVTLLSTSLADQDIYNAVIKRHSRIVKKLPCHFNLQLNNHTDADESCHDYQSQEINIVHWNTPQKLMTNNKLAEYFKLWYLTFQDWNAKLLERDGCPKPTKSIRLFDDSFLSELTEMNKRLSDDCYDYKPRPDDLLRTFLYYNDYEVETQDATITVVVHLSLDRFQAFEQLATRWPGPISAAIYLNDAETGLLMSYIEKSSALASRRNIGYHLVFKVPDWHYPINKLRNIALDNVITPFVFLVDVDFLPSKDLQTYVQQVIASLPRNGHECPLDKRALVIPAFENDQYKFVFPETKSELIAELDRGNITTFRDRVWSTGQEQTDYARWRRATTPYKVEWKADYEPFIVTGKNVAKFDERFVGFGWNKVAHTMSLEAANYEFLVLPEAFIIHQYHAPSREIEFYRHNQGYKWCINQLKRDVNKKLLFSSKH